MTKIEKKEQGQQIENRNMVDINLTMLTITFNINSLKRTN